MTHTPTLHTEVEKRTLLFKQPATTSRGSYTQRTIRLIHLSDDNLPGIIGTGECSPLPDLSIDALDDNQFDRLLLDILDDFHYTGQIDYNALAPYPSILFALESANWQLQRHGSYALTNTPFAQGTQGIPINGLVWMGSYNEMMTRMNQKISQGFKCIKIKIGGIDFDHELMMIQSLRQTYGYNLQIRLDANGSFTPDNALHRLEQLAPYKIHSIEQPIKPHQWPDLAKLCQKSPIPIALDEELIGITTTTERQQLLETIRPQYIVIKPTLHGGMSGTAQWIRLAHDLNIGSWLTSALESNVALNVIAHLAAAFYAPQVFGTPHMLHQGLGTGQLFEQNINTPLQIRGEQLFFTPNK